MARFYTRSGDDGYTGFLGKGRIAKSDPRIEALGALDETSACLGMAKAFTSFEMIRLLVTDIQCDLYNMMAEVAATPENATEFQKVDQSRIEWLEIKIQALEVNVTVPKEFILPGDTQAGAIFDLARAITRRAERSVVRLFQQKEIANPTLQQYLNRLSSLCFMLELFENQSKGKTTLVKPTY
jgi:cob(I)alamin adenosyltransferase